MHYIVFVQIFEGAESLAEELEGLGLADGSVLVLVGEEGAILGQLHNHVNDVIFDKRVPQLDDVRVVDPRMQIDFPLEQQYLVLVDGSTNIDLNGARLTTLMAKHLLVWTWRANLTVPKEPTPIYLMKLNSETEVKSRFVYIRSLIEIMFWKLIK